MYVDVYRWRRSYVAVVGWFDGAEGVLAHGIGPKRSMQACLPRIVDWPAVVSRRVSVIQKHFHAGYRFAIKVEDGPA